MDETLKKAVNLGLGAFVFTREKIESLVRDMTEKGEMGKEEGIAMLNRLVEKGDALREDVEKAAKKFVDGLELPSRGEFEELKSEVEKLKKKKAAS